MTDFAESLGERQFVSRFSQFTAGLKIYDHEVLRDADDVVVVEVTTLDGSDSILNSVATHESTGVYSFTLSSRDTSAPGLYAINWSYNLDGVGQIYVTYIEVGGLSTSYDALSVGLKGVVESAWIRFADLFDSPYGGPHLQSYFQSKFDRGRMAQLLQIAVGRLNTISQPHTSYSLIEPPNGPGFPIDQWGGLLDQALYIECLKHLMRSYVEQPEVQGVSVARQDRRDYLQRWQTILEMEQKDFDRQLETFKIAHMGLGRPRVLVSGGVYGEWGMDRIPGLMAARGYWARRY